MWDNKTPLSHFSLAYHLFFLTISILNIPAEISFSQIFINQQLESYVY
ncbi:hypothetical protein [Xenorhabdus sp. PB62.4]|nr:hypothetical protein [Xenorhabdus sp. PB62.4]